MGLVSNKEDGDILKKNIGIYLDKELLSQADACIEKANCRTRNEFIANAVRFYVTHLNAKANTELLTPAFESVVAGAVKDSENKIVRLIFKLAVEVSMMLNVISYHFGNDIDEIKLTELRKNCVDIVAKTNGRFTFEDAYKFQITNDN